ncbi:hypothetical protein HN662_03605 [Candidatus Woesearchaeota archaeon]|nr:hypothetical protein [Candidatus Woesearchaeota archaeon]
MALSYNSYGSYGTHKVTKGMNISQEKLIALLKEAFDEGWFGYLELRDDTCKCIAAKVFGKTAKRRAEEYFIGNILEEDDAEIGALGGGAFK